MLAQGLVANQQDFTGGVPKVFAEKMDGCGVIPHNLIDDDVGGHSQSLHSIYLSFFCAFIVSYFWRFVNTFFQKKWGCYHPQLLAQAKSCLFT